MDILLKKILLLVSNIVFISYISYVIYKYGILDSISESYYRLPKKWNFLFTLMLWFFSFPILMVGVEYTPFMFLAGVSIMFVGAAPDYKRSQLEHNVHYGAAIIGISTAIVTMTFLFKYYWMLPVFLLSSLFIIYKSKENYIWWIELVAFLLIIIGLYLNIYS